MAKFFLDYSIEAVLATYSSNRIISADSICVINPSQFARMHKYYAGTESSNFDSSQPRFCDHDDLCRSSFIYFYTNQAAHTHITSHSLLMGLLVSNDKDQ